MWCGALVVQLCLTLYEPMGCSPPGSSVCGDFPGKNTGVSCHALLQGIFPTQGSNAGLPYCKPILYHLSHQLSPWIQEWVAYSVSRGSSQPRNRTGVFCVAGRFFTSWATREVPIGSYFLPNLIFKALHQFWWLHNILPINCFVAFLGQSWSLLFDNENILW